MADYVSGEEKCGVPAPNGASVCARDKGHDGHHRNAWSTAEWPWQAPATSPRCEARRDVDADTVRGYATFRCGLSIGHPGSHQVERAAGGPLIWKQSAEHTPRAGGPGMQPCGNVGPFDGVTCERAVGHSGHHAHNQSGIRLVWADVTEESVAKQLTGLQRKVKAQANQINKLEELRKASVDKSPEYQALKRHLDSQASLTMRESELRRQAGELISKVAELKNARAEDKAAHPARPAVTGHDVVQMLMGPSAEYGTTPLAVRVAGLTKNVNRLTGLVPGNVWNTGAGALASQEQVAAVNRKLTDFVATSREEWTRLNELIAKVALRTSALENNAADMRAIRRQDVEQIATLSDQLADAQAAAGWREQCNSRTQHKLIGHKCQRAAGHTGQHNSDTQSGGGRTW